MLLKDLSENFKRPKLLLTLTISALTDYQFGDKTFAEQSAHFDFIHLLPFGIDDYIITTFTINDATKEMDHLKNQRKIDDLIKWGIPSAKIIMGTHFGGVSFDAKFNESENNAKINGMPGYGSICETVKQNGLTWQKTYDDATKLTVLKGTNQTTNKQHLIVYGNGPMIVDHMKFVVERNLGGALSFFVHLDDFNGKCAIDGNTLDDFKLEHDDDPQRNNTTTFPLLRIMNKTITLSVEENHRSSANDLPISIGTICIFGLFDIWQFVMVYG